MGDFNCAPGHIAHRTLTHNGKFIDSWVDCENRPSCYTNRVSTTYHHYFGDQLDYRPLFRLFQFIGFTVHGRRFPEWNRFHIDWILYRN